jgi:hypothetical protein
MTVKQETKFKSSDGREFDNETEALRHDELAVAREEYEHALAKMNGLIVKTTRTADGYLCELGIWIDYWYISPGWHGLPNIHKVPYLGWNWDLSRHHDEVVIVHRETGRERTDEYAISSLYRNKKNALVALVEAQKEWLQERQDEIANIAATLSCGSFYRCWNRTALPVAQQRISRWVSLRYSRSCSR